MRLFWLVGVVALIMMTPAGTASGAEGLAADTAGGKRVALVIGNSDYPELGKLRNPENDAAALARVLATLGFSVDVILDGDRARLLQGLRRFGRAASGAETALFYYAGHGIQMAGENYLVPVGAKIAIERDLRYETISASDIKQELKTANARLSIVVLDACRDNPLARTLARNAAALGRSLDVRQGLAPITGARGMLIAYATAPGELALDGDGANSPFTAALVEHIDDPGIDIRVMFARVRQAVVSATDGYQTPWVEEAVIGEFQLKAGPLPEDPNVAAARVWATMRENSGRPELTAFLERFGETPFADLARARLVALDGEVEASSSGGAAAAGRAWATVRDSRSPEELQAFIDGHGKSEFAELARERLEELQRENAPDTAAGKSDGLIAAATAWDAVKDSEDRTALAAFLAEYGDSPFADLALARLVAMAPGTAPVYRGHPPTIGPISPIRLKISDGPAPLMYSVLPHDQDGDPFKVTVEGIPSTGSLENVEDGALTEGTAFPEDKLNQLFFRPNRISSGHGTIRLRATDVNGDSKVYEIDVTVRADTASDIELLRREKAMGVASLGRVQAHLGTLGHYSGPIDGQVGPDTRKAIRNFQAAIGTKQTGLLTANELFLLVERSFAKRAIRDCEICPEMIEIPGGVFRMGPSPSDVSKADYRRYGPQRTVSVPRFFIGRFEVTYREWDRCVADRACRNVPDSDFARGSMPVSFLRWTDANDYVDWLARKTGIDFRLPSEAEWEYAARATTTTIRYWGNHAGVGIANCRECDSSFTGRWPWNTWFAPIGSYPPNQFGLYDALGNVEEWVQDCFSGNYKGVPVDGSAFEQGGCREHVVRGGDAADYGLRISGFYRRGDRASDAAGLRVARSP